MSDAEARERRCVDCGCSSPAQASEYTLISHGWRFTKQTAPDGKLVIERRCSDCFTKFRARARMPA